MQGSVVAWNGWHIEQDSQLTTPSAKHSHKVGNILIAKKYLNWLGEKEKMSKKNFQLPFSSILGFNLVRITFGLYHYMCEVHCKSTSTSPTTHIAPWQCNWVHGVKMGNEIKSTHEYYYSQNDWFLFMKDTAWITAFMRNKKNISPGDCCKQQVVRVWKYLQISLDIGTISNIMTTISSWRSDDSTDSWLSTTNQTIWTK